MLAVAILAAGKGTRMKSSLPKVLQPLGGITLLERVLQSFSDLKPHQIFLIVGHQGNLVKEHLNHLSALQFVEQQPQLGTGHAVQQLLPVLKEFKGDLLVLNGDVPLLRSQTIEKLLSKHKDCSAEVTFLTSRLKNPDGYGRVFADKNNNVQRIVEDRDCNEDQKKNNLINAGIYCFNWNKLKEILPNLSSKNNQGELYITDSIKMLSHTIHVEVDDPEEISGINDRKQLADCEYVLQKKLREYWMGRGVTFIDQNSCTLSELCEFGQDVRIEPQTHFRGKCTIGDGCKIGPGTLIENSVLGNNVKIIYSVLNGAHLANNIEIGPFAHLRPNSNIAAKCKIGNFVEIKKSNIGEETKVNHLSYIGDSDLGNRVNVGAGTITANFDGKKKHRTLIGNDSKTGANSVLIAPISLGVGVTVGAGSTLNKDVPDFSLALARAKQLVKSNWRNPANNP